jgi:hypothetical protein
MAVTSAQGAGPSKSHLFVVGLLGDGVPWGGRTKWRSDGHAKEGSQQRSRKD